MRFVYVNDDDFGPLWFNAAFIWSLKVRKNVLHIVTTEDEVTYTETHKNEDAAKTRLLSLRSELANA